MKKIIMSVVTVVFAFGAIAAGSGNGFEHCQVGPYDTATPDGPGDAAVYFTAVDDEDEDYVSINAYAGDSYDGSYGFPTGFSGVGEKCLQFKTRFGCPLVRSINPVENGRVGVAWPLEDDLWLDMLLMPTALDEQPDWTRMTERQNAVLQASVEDRMTLGRRVIPDGKLIVHRPMGAILNIDDKLRLFYFEDEEGEHVDLYAQAGHLNSFGQAPTLETYRLTGKGIPVKRDDYGYPRADVWQRVTIRAVKDITQTGSGIAGFQIFINGMPVFAEKLPVSEERIAAAGDSLSVEVKSQLLADAFFPAYGWGETPQPQVSFFGFDGTGKLDDLSVSMSAPEFWKEHKVTFNLGEHGKRIGGGALEQFIRHGFAATAPEVTSDNGSRFIGWFTAAEGGTKVEDLTVTESDQTFYAHWAGILSVTAQQRYPWNGLVDITVTMQGTAEDMTITECSFAATNGATKAVIPIEHITCNGTDSVSDCVWTRRYVWDAKADVGAVKIDDVALTVGAKTAGVQLWENGPYWAEYNVGATKPEESGYYFWWGDTVGYRRTVRYFESSWDAVDGSRTGFSFTKGNCPTYGKNKTQLQSMGYIDSTGNLVASHDAAAAHLGSPWRMPTDADFASLVGNCTTAWTTCNGVYGRLVTGKGVYASKSIFLPAAGGDDSYIGLLGWYWSSSPCSDSSPDASRCLVFSSDDSFGSNEFHTFNKFRNYGLTVRPLREFSGIRSAVAPLATHLQLDCRAGVRMVSSDGDDLYCDASWYAKGRQVRIADNGEDVDLDGSEMTHWKPADYGVHQLRMTVVDSNGARVGSEIAYFAYVPSDGDIVIPDGWTELPSELFRDCVWLTEVSIPNSVVNISATAFAGCENLKTATVQRKDYDFSVFPAGCQIVYDIDYPVVFDLGERGKRVGGGELEQTIHHGDAAVAPEVEAEYGWGFVRWDKDFSAVTDPLTVKAVWRRMKWPVVVTNPDGTETQVDVEHEAKHEFVAPEPTVDMDGTRQVVVLGTTYTAPEVANRFEVTVTNGFAFAWDILQTNYWFAVGEAAHGAIQPETDGWKPDGAVFTLTAVADEDYRFVEWTGDVEGCEADGASVTVTMNRARTVSAVFGLNPSEAEIGGVVWTYVMQDGVAVVFKEGGAAVSGEVAGEVVVPATLGGYPVRAIGSGAFAGCGDVETIVLPQNLVEVGEGAFAGCSNLVSVVLPEGVTAIPPWTFEDCAAIEELVIPAGVQTIGEEAFAGCVSLKTVEIPEGVTEIAARTFAGCEKLSSVKLPESLELIDAEAFAGCAALGSVTIPANVSEIGENAFGECKGLGSVRFHGQPPTGIRTSGLLNEKVTIHGPADVTISPADRTVFGTDLAVTLTTSWAGGVVRYTLDGSAPTAESPAFDGITIHNKTTVRAATFVEGLRWSEIEEATYGVGKVATPTASSTQGSTFYHNGNWVSLDCATAGVEIRYTFGGEPTANSTLYTGPFEISRTTTVKAKAFGHPDYVDSDVMTTEFVRAWEGLATPAISPEGGLIEAECELVTISCESEDVTIYYTLDGSRPSATNGRVYTGPFKLYQSGKVKAIATKFDWADSEVASVTFTRGDQLGEALNYFGAKVTNDANAPWTVDTAESHDGVSAVRSAAVEDGMSGIKLTVKGAGRLSFWWKASCEEVWDGEYYDYGSFKVGLEEKEKIAGRTDWQRVVIDFEATDKHTLHWDYVKDDDNDEGKDCIWVDQVVWIPADGSGVTLTTGEPVPYAWLEGYGLGVTTDFETAANAKTGKWSAFGKELTVWEDYVTGTNPTNLNSVFRTFIDMSSGVPKISWEPDLNENGTKHERIYQVWGAKDLNAQWFKVDGDEGAYNFFKITVGLP